jgi:hypothetical protein
VAGWIRVRGAGKVSSTGTVGRRSRAGLFRHTTGQAQQNLLKNKPPMKGKRKTQLIDVNDPKGSILRVADDMERREVRRKARAALERKLFLIADTPEAVHWLGRFFYRPVAQALLADPANFDKDGMPTDDAMQQAAETMVEAAANALMEFTALEADEIFHRIRLKAFADRWGLED